MLDADNYETNPELKKIYEERGYPYMAHFLQDVCEVYLEKLPNYEEKIKSFFEEHLHTNEEIRYYVAGSDRCNFLLFFIVLRQYLVTFFTMLHC
ncbi:hypothetical protein HN51_031982 [Arachis hypogaea]